VTCAVSWGRCSLFGLLVVMSVVIVLVLLFISFLVDGVGTNKQENQYNHNGHNNQKPVQRTTTPRNSTRHILDPNIITLV